MYSFFVYVGIIWFLDYLWAIIQWICVLSARTLKDYEFQKNLSFQAETLICYKLFVFFSNFINEVSCICTIFLWDMDKRVNNMGIISNPWKESRESWKNMQSWLSVASFFLNICELPWFLEKISGVAEWLISTSAF